MRNPGNKVRQANKNNQTPSNKASDFKGTLKKILNLLKQYKISIIIVIILSIGSSIFSIIGPKILGNATTEIFNGLILKINNQGGINFDAIKNVLIVLSILYIISTVFSIIQGIVMGRISEKIGNNLRKKISDKIHKIPMKYFDKTNTGEILSIITNDIDTLSQNLNQSLTQVISSVVMILGILYMMITISPIMTLAALLILPISFGGVGFIISKSQKHFEKQQDYLGNINGNVEEMYGGHTIVKAFNGEEKAIINFEDLNNKLYNSAWKSQFLSGMMMPLMTFVGNLGYVVVSILGGYLVVKNKIEVGSILSFTQYIRQFNQQFAGAAQLSSLLQATAASAERVFNFLDLEEEVKEINNPINTNNIKGTVTFKNVTFGYSEDKLVINNFNIEIKTGQKIAIVGPTGAGKTTIVKLLMRFYDVTDGEILIDNHNIKNFKRSDLRKLFGMVLQDSWLFSGSIKDNIKYGKLDATDEEITKAAIAARVDHFVKTLPDNYDMELNEEANNISQGQKQLLTIARVILANPKILILDEATSSVDTRTEILIQEAMDNLMKNRTSFIIAHRLSTIKNADLILVMDQGDIVEVGNHNDLLKKKGFYYKLYNSQFEKVEK